jgi:hypothetical protein
MGTPLAPPSPADQLRQRAAALRAFATVVENASVCRLGQLVGSDTWIGPGPNACATDVGSIRVRMDSAAAALRDSARILESQASALPVLEGPR